MKSQNSHSAIRYVFAVWFALMAMALAPVVAAAQDDSVKRPRAIDLLPERTAIYLQINDVQQLFTDFSESNFGAMLKDPDIAPLMEKIYGKAKEAFDNLDAEEELGFSLSELSSLPAGEICLAIITPRREEPKVALIMDVPEDSDLAERILGRVRRAVEEDGDSTFGSDSIHGIDYETVNGGSEDEQVFYTLHEGTFVACSNEKVFGEIIGRWQGSPPKKNRILSGNRKFLTIMNKCKSTEDLPMSMSFFVDPIMLARSITAKDTGAKLFFAALPVLGLDGLSAFGGSALFNEKNYESVFHGHLLLANPRAGVIDMIALRPGFYEPESFIPEDTVTYMTSSWNFRKFMAELENIVDTFSGKGTFQQQIQENINEELDIDFQGDVLENLAGRVTYVQWIGDKPTLDGQCNALVVQVEDQERAEDFLLSILDRMDENEFTEGFIEEETHKGITYWKARESFEGMARERRERRRQRRREDGNASNDDDDDDNRTKLDLLETTPCYCFIDDHFIVTGTVQMMEQMIETHKGEHKNLIDNPEFKETVDEIRQLLDGELPSIMSYSRPDRALEMLYEVVQSDNTRDVLYERAEDNEFFRVLSELVEENELPAFESLRKYFPPQGMFVVNDDTGFHMLWFQKRAVVEKDE